MKRLLSSSLLSNGEVFFTIPKNIFINIELSLQLIAVEIFFTLGTSSALELFYNTNSMQLPSLVAPASLSARQKSTMFVLCVCVICTKKNVWIDYFKPATILL